MGLTGAERSRREVRGKGGRLSPTLEGQTERGPSGGETIGRGPSREEGWANTEESGALGTKREGPAEAQLAAAPSSAVRGGPTDSWPRREDG